MDGSRYAEIESVDPSFTVSKLIARWVADKQLGVDPSLVTLRLVKRGPDKLPKVPSQRSALEADAQELSDPSETLAEAGLADGSWLLADLATAAAGALLCQREPKYACCVRAPICH